MRAVSIALVALAVTACGTVEASKPSVEVDMRNVDLHIAPQIDLHIRHLRGRFVAAGTRPAPYLDDPSSYTVMVDTGEVAVELPSLNAIVGGALERAHSNVRRVEISATATAKNHIYWRGGQLAFGKLTMADTDLELVDEDPRDAFDFSVDRWNEQLVAGYSKTSADRGLRAHMPDYNDLKR
jgi:hypothetical protein